MFADYRVPQVLYHFGILNYDETLIRHLRLLKPMKKNSEMEVAIRGLSIYACEVGLGVWDGNFVLKGVFGSFLNRKAFTSLLDQHLL